MCVCREPIVDVYPRSATYGAATREAAGALLRNAGKPKPRRQPMDDNKVQARSIFALDRNNALYNDLRQNLEDAQLVHLSGADTEDRASTAASLPSAANVSIPRMPSVLMGSSWGSSRKGVSVSSLFPDSGMRSAEDLIEGIGAPVGKRRMLPKKHTKVRLFSSTKRTRDLFEGIDLGPH